MKYSRSTFSIGFVFRKDRSGSLLPREGDSRERWTMDAIDCSIELCTVVLLLFCDQTTVSLLVVFD